MRARVCPCRFWILSSPPRMKMTSCSQVFNRCFSTWRKYTICLEDYFPFSVYKKHFNTNNKKHGRKKPRYCRRAGKGGFYKASSTCRKEGVGRLNYNFNNRSKLHKLNKFSSFFNPLLTQTRLAEVANSTGVERSNFWLSELTWSDLTMELWNGRNSNKD